MLHTIKEQDVLPPVYDDLRPLYDAPSKELVAKLRVLSKGRGAGDEKVKDKAKQALELTYKLSITGVVTNKTRDQATKFHTLILQIQESLRQKDEVLLFRKEAVRLQRVLSFGARPGSTSQGELAVSLRNLAMALHENDQNAEACMLDEEALTIRRECCHARPGDERVLLAMMLHTYSLHLAAEERYEDALEAIEEVVKIRRLLYEFDPEESMKGLANVLQERGIRLSSVQRFEDARASDEEALALRRILYQKDPEKHRASLIRCLGNYCTTLKDLGLPKETNAVLAEWNELRKVAA